MTTPTQALPPHGFRAATPADRAWAEERYRAVAFRPSDPDDLVLVAVDAEGSAVGVGRVVRVTEDAGELGGMYVAPDHRGRGLAEALVRRLVDAAPQATLWCLPFARLADLYRRCGFADVATGDPVPDAVAAKLAWCAETYPEAVILLRRTR